MTTQPTALRLADALETAPAHVLQDNTVTLELGTSTATKAAAELRRLAEVEGKLEGQIDRLVAQRDALLEALKELMSDEAVEDGMRWADACDKARDAIKAVEGE